MHQNHQSAISSGMNGIILTAGQLKKLNPSYALEAERTNALVGFNPGLATLGFHQKAFHDVVKTLVLLSRCEAEKMLLHFLDEKQPSASPASPASS